MRVVGIVAPFAPMGAGTRGKFILSSPRGEMGPEDVRSVPLAAVRHGRARQTSESGPGGDCRRVLWEPGPRAQYSGKIRFIEKYGVQDEGGRHVAKYSSDPRQAYPEVKLQGRDLVRVVGIVALFAPMGAGTRGKFVYSSPRGEMGPVDVRRVPLAAVRHGRARQTSESVPGGDCRRVLWEPGPRGQYSGKIRFIEKYGVQDEGGRHVAKYSSDPRQAYPEVKLQGRDLVRVVGIVAPFAPMGAGTRGKFVLSSPRGEMGPEDVRREPLAAVRHGRARQTSESGQGGDCRRVLWEPGPRGQYSGKIRFIEKYGVKDEGGRHVAKYSSDPRQAYPEVKLQGRDLVRVVGIVAPFAPMGAVTRGKFVYSSPRGEMGPEDVRRLPQAAVRNWRARQTSESGPDGDCRRVLWEPGPRGQYSGKIRFIQKYGVQDEGGRHVDKYSSDPRQAYPEVKLQGRDLVRVVGIVAPFAPMGAGTRGKFVYSSPRGEMGQEDVRRVPLAAVRHGRARQHSESGQGGDCRRVLWEPGPRGQYSGKIRFIEKYGVQDEGGRHVAKYSSDPRQAYPEVKLQGRDLVRVVGIVAPFAPMGAGTRGKFVYSSPRGEMGPEDMRRVPLAAVRHGRARQTSESGPGGDCRRVLWELGPRGQYSGKIRFIEKYGVQDEGGRHVAKYSSDPRQAYPEVKL